MSTNTAEMLSPTGSAFSVEDAENLAATKLQKAWRGKATSKYMEHIHQLMPVLIIPAIAGSGLKIEKSAISPSFEGTRVWMNAAMLAMSRVTRKVHNEDEIFDVKEKNEKSVEEEDFIMTKEACHQVKSAWLHHMSLGSDMETERPGNRVRAYEGLKGVEHMSDDVVTQLGSWVHAPVVKSLLKVGYVRGENLDAAPYDWRLPPACTEERDGYLSKTKAQIEDMYKRNWNRPVILLCHSMGCKMGHYFLCWAHKTHGKEWVDKYVYSYMPIGSPACGVSLAVRTGLVGKGLSPEVDFLMADESEGLIMYRSWGSGGWLMPRYLPKHVPPSVIARKEGSLLVSLGGAIDLGTLFSDRKQPPKEMRLMVKLRLPRHLHSIRVRTPYVKVKTIDQDKYILELPEESFHFALPEETKPDEKLGLLKLVLEAPAGRVQMMVLDVISRKIAKTLNAGTRVARTKKIKLTPDMFDDMNRLSATYEMKTLKPNRLKGNVSVKLQYQPSSGMAPNKTDTPISAISDDLVDNEKITNIVPIGSKSRLESNVRYEALSGHQLYAMDVFCKDGFERVIRERYEKDPLEPRTYDCPPVQRVNAIYGINVPTEVCAVLRHRPYIVVGDANADSRYVIDTECKWKDIPQEVGKSSLFNWKDLHLSNGILMETNTTRQQTVDENGKTVFRKVCGDGTVPYWNLAHCKTWRPHLKELTVDELEGAGHRGILAESRFHELIKKYCVVPNLRTAALVRAEVNSGTAQINLSIPTMSSEEL